MKLQHGIIAFVLIDFLALSGYAISEVGYLGIWQAGLASIGSIQILTDLIIACGLILSWMIVDARQRGITLWPFIVITLAAGSIGPLLYLLFRARKTDQIVATSP